MATPRISSGVFFLFRSEQTDRRKCINWAEERQVGLMKNLSCMPCCGTVGCIEWYNEYGTDQWQAKKTRCMSCCGTVDCISWYNKHCIMCI